MSIIYDALKKVEESRVKAPVTKTDESVKPTSKSYLLYALLITIALFIANLWLLPKAFLRTSGTPLDNRTPAVKNKAVSAATPGIIPLANIAAPSVSVKTGPERFILSGVFFSGDEGYALINNRIVKKGDEIDGATVSQVFLDEVELEYRGSKITLSNSVN